MSWLALRRDEAGAAVDQRDVAAREPAVERRTVRRERRSRHTEVDAGALAVRLRALPGTEALRVHSLGQGIVELVGSAAGSLDVPGVIKTLADQPGVSVVVNRVWTPESAAHT